MLVNVINVDNQRLIIFVEMLFGGRFMMVNDTIIEGLWLCSLCF